MKKNPVDYTNDRDGIIIPEIYFQYLFEDTPYILASSFVPNDRFVLEEDFLSIIKKHTGIDKFKVLSEGSTAYNRKVVIVAYNKPLMIWYDTYPSAEVNGNLRKLKEENENDMSHLKIKDFNRIASIYLVTATEEVETAVFDTKDKLQEFISEVYTSAKLEDSEENNLVFTLGAGQSGPKLDSHFLRLTTYGKEIIESNYNDDFREVYDVVYKFLTEDNSSGLVLFDGAPGTGKTSIIKHFISMCSDLDRRIIVVPSAFAPVLSEPSFLTFATDQLKDSILLLEDAETALQSRDGVNSNPAVSNILNISDGILGDILCVKIIATVNTSSNIDKALTRRGRLVASYTFNLLKKDKAKKLAISLDVDPNEIKEDMALSDIYNRSRNTFGDSGVNDITVGFKQSGNKLEDLGEKEPKPKGKIGGFGG